MVLAVAYVLLAIRQHIACWSAAILSAAIYTSLMFRAGLYMQSALQVCYIAMAIYGWHHWRRGTAGGAPLPVSSWPLRAHVVPLATILVLALPTGYLLANSGTASSPYLDALTGWGAIVTTGMVARKIIQNWYYWFVIDLLSIHLYYAAGLTLTALLFCLYVVLAVFGYFEWRKELQPVGT